ncbi:MAG: transcription elongation factor GreA [Chloroflexi bacterium]|nr:transcription elongation factor GreA [Chloroflexota bacterium]
MVAIDKPAYLTNKGKTELGQELMFLQTVKRLEIIDRLQDARGGGDWMDSTEHMLIEEELAFVDGRIRELNYMLYHAQIIEPDNENNIVDVGETVVIETSDGELEEYTIIGVAEADPGNGLISNESPLGQALLNHKVGEEVVVQAPVGELRYRIVAVR